MPRNRTRTLGRPAVGAAVVMALGVVLAGCSDEAADDAAPAPSAAASSGAAVAADTVTLAVDAVGTPFAYPKGPAEISATVRELPPGQETDPARTRVPVLVHVIDGIITVVVDGSDAATVVTGRSVVLPLRTPYVLANRDGSTARFVTLRLGRQAAP